MECAEEEGTQEQAAFATLFLASPQCLWQDPAAMCLHRGKPKSSSAGLAAL